jgi:hypothetical protein
MPSGSPHDWIGWLSPVAAIHCNVGADDRAAVVPPITGAVTDRPGSPWIP